MQEPSTTTITTPPAAVHQPNSYGDEMTKKVNALGTLLLKEVAQSKQALALYVVNNLIAEAKSMGRHEQWWLEENYRRQDEEARKKHRQVKESR